MARGASGDVGNAAGGAEALGELFHPAGRAEAALFIRLSQDPGHLAAQGECLLRREIRGQLGHEPYELTHVGGAADAVLGSKPPLELHTGRRPRRGTVQEIAEAVRTNRDLSGGVPERLAGDLARDGITQERHRERRHTPVVDLYLDLPLRALCAVALRLHR